MSDSREFSLGASVTLGDPARFGIRISKGSRPDSPQVEVFIAHENLSVEKEPYIHACITSLANLSGSLKGKIDYLKYWNLLAPLENLTQIHQLVWRGFPVESAQAEDLRNVYRFEWGYPERGDPVVLFVPYCELMHLTFHWPSKHCDDTCELHRDLTARVSGVQIGRISETKRETERETPHQGLSSGVRG